MSSCSDSEQSSAQKEEKYSLQPSLTLEAEEEEFNDEDEDIFNSILQANNILSTRDNRNIEDIHPSAAKGGGEPFISICERLFLLPKSKENSNRYGLSMTQLLAGTLFCWSLSHLLRYALLSAKSVTIREAPLPSPFFPPLSSVFVQDFYRGQIEEPEVLISRAEFTIVMLYAPWDSRSKEFRRSFIQIAASFSNLRSLRFIAANCHYHRGKCRRNYKLLTFPVIFAHTPYGQPILFNEPLSLLGLFSWIRHLIVPLDALNSLEDHRRLVNRMDFTIIGFFPALHFPPPRHFNVFLNTAYKAVGMRQSLAFGTVLDRHLAAELALSKDTSADPNGVLLHFHTFYEANNGDERPSATFQIGPNTKSEEVIRWLNDCMKRYTAEAVHELEFEDLEHQGKLEALYQKVMNSSPPSNATLVLFTHLLGLREQPSSLIALKNFAKLYNHHCPNGTVDKEVEQLMGLKPLQAIPLEEHLLKLATKCPSKLERREQGADDVCPLKERRKEGRKKTTGETNADWRHQMDCKLHRLIRKRQPHILREYFGTEKAVEKIKQARDEEVVLPSMDLLLAQKQQREDGQLRGPAGCTRLGFLAIDKTFGVHFRHKWGGGRAVGAEDLMEDAVALVSPGQERIFWMDGPVGLPNLAQFVANFTEGIAPWVPENEQILAPMKEEGGEDEDEEDWHEYAVSRVAKLNRQMLEEEVLGNENRSHDVVVLFSGGDWHGPTRVILHCLHQVQHYFQPFRELIHFHILDTTKNSLPRQFSFERLPVLVLFPAKRPRESHVFPLGVALTVPNLLAFIFHRCQQRLKWRLAFALCNSECLARNAERIGKTLGKVREEMRLMGARRRRRRMGQASLGGELDLSIQLNRRRLQRAVLARMLELVHNTLARRRRNGGGPAGDREEEDEELFREFTMLNSILASRFGLNYKFR